ncbi:MAG TPA: hypothetical protein VF103_05525 [Polyangiaceae bacterium]
MACSRAPVDEPAVAPKAPETIHFEAGGPVEGAACRLELRRRGCRTMPFQGTCAAYFSANDDELTKIRASGYLNLGFRGDREPERSKPAFVPWNASRAFVGSGLSIGEITALAHLAGGIESPYGLMWPSERVARAVAFSDSFVSIAWAISPDTLRALAGIRDLHALAERWDAHSREKAADIEFGPDSVRECEELLSHLVTVAKDAAQTGRAMYAVQSLPTYRPSCRDLGGCGGYGCDEDTEKVNTCHSPNDDCIRGLDCSKSERCSYDRALSKWTCRPEAGKAVTE